MRCPFARWLGSPNDSPHAMLEHRGLVLHIQQGYETGTDATFQNPASRASAHFGVAKTGQLDEWVDTDDKAWAEAAGNAHWVSVEIEGFSGQLATAEQVATIARLYAWLAGVYGFPFVSTDSPDGSGLGWHGMGGAAWGGHYDCPGDPIKGQRAQILALAAGGAPAPVQPPISHGWAEGVRIDTTFYPAGQLDPNGHGWIDVPAPFDAVVSFTPQGSSPPDNGYWSPVHVQAQPRDDHTRVTFYGAAGQTTGVFVKVLTG